MNFGENLHNELEYRDVTIKELSYLTGISKNTLDKYLSGKKVQPNVENAVKIAKALGVTVEYLAGESNDKSEQLLSQNQIKILNQYKKLSPANQENIKDIMEVLFSRQ